MVPLFQVIHMEICRLGINLNDAVAISIQTPHPHIPKEKLEQNTLEAVENL